MAKNLRQSHEVVAVAFEELVRHRVTEEVRVQLDAEDGRWKSKDGSVFYLAIGIICDKQGNPIRKEKGK